MYKAVQIAKDVYWVGAIDYTERLFHGYTMYRGTTYNAYLIVDEKVTLIDTVKSSFAPEMLERIASVVDPATIDYLISNHVEQDHSGSIPQVMAIAEKATLITSAPSGLKGLQAHYGPDFNYQGVKNGESLNIGERTLTFVHTPFVHWPDNMVTYDEQDKILFSNDAFGQHFASGMRFDDQVDVNKVMAQAQKYYANIVFPYCKQASKALSACKDLNIALIAPAHGIIWREHVDTIMGAYAKWTSQQLEDMAVIAFDSMYHQTERIARTIADAFTDRGITVRLYDLKSDHISDVIAQVLTARYIAVGSPTLNSTTMPTVAAFLNYLSGLLPKGTERMGFAFGSYGWAAKGPQEIAEKLDLCGLEMPCDPFTCQWRISDEQLAAIYDAVKAAI